MNTGTEKGREKLRHRMSETIGKSNNEQECGETTKGLCTILRGGKVREKTGEIEAITFPTWCTPHHSL
jgi:hypothetical protein